MTVKTEKNLHTLRYTETIDFWVPMSIFFSKNG